jgi:cephalosporin-C deacetylase
MPIDFMKTRIPILLMCFLVLLTGIATAKNSKKAVAKEEEDEIVLTLKPVNKQAEYAANAPIKYNLSIKNNLGETQTGKITYAVANLDWTGKVIKEMPVSVGTKTLKTFNLDLPGRNTGLYHIEIYVNLTEYDDTLRKICVVDPEHIRSKYPRPDDFDQFWDGTKAELAKVAPKFKMTEQDSLAKPGFKVYLFEMQSLGNVTVRGWLTIPKGKKNEKFPVWLGLPGYQVALKPIYGSGQMAIITLNVRGQGNSKDQISVPRNDFITLGIEDKKKYVFRGVIMDCIRTIDFIQTVPQLDKDLIYATGGSMGGYLAIVLASLDKRVALCSAENPVFADWRSMVGNIEWPMKDVEKYGRAKYIMPEVLNTLDYYDLKNFAPRLETRVLIGMGLLDPLAPPYNTMVMFNNIPGKKKLKVYPDLTHEVPPQHTMFESLWMMDNLGMY